MNLFVDFLHGKLGDVVIRATEHVVIVAVQVEKVDFILLNFGQVFEFDLGESGTTAPLGFKDLLAQFLDFFFVARLHSVDDFLDVIFLLIELGHCRCFVYDKGDPVS